MRYYRPATAPEDWRALLANPDRQWQPDASAALLAHRWHAAAGFPPEVAAALDSAPDSALHQLTPLLGIPEHQVRLTGRGHPTQTDLWVLARGAGGLVSLAIEGKAAEPFGPTLQAWRRNASLGKQRRLAALIELLELPATLPDDLHYQLLHRSAAAIVEAQRFGARQAVLLIHSFSPTHAWFEQFAAYAALLGGTVKPGTITSVGERAGVACSLGWVAG